MLVGGAVRVLEGLREHGREWAETRECAALVADVLRDGASAEVVATVRALRQYRVLQAARQAVGRYHPRAARRALVARRLTGRELVAALVAWAERDGQVQLEDGVLQVPTEALLRFVAHLGDRPKRVLHVLRAGGLLESEAGEDGPTVTVRVPRGARVG